MYTSTKRYLLNYIIRVDPTQMFISVEPSTVLIMMRVRVDCMIDEQDI